MAHQPVVTLAWASRKRHIFLDGALLCEKKGKTTGGYSVKGRHYISYQLEMPTTPLTIPDQQYSHGEGTIPFEPIDSIKIGAGGISRRSICASCQKKYKKLLTLEK